MTIFVDDMRRPARVGRIKDHWSHLFTDQDDQTELHAFAARLGLRRAWFQGARWEATHPWRCHYDVTDSVRDRALALGAQPVTYPHGMAELIERRKQARRAGIPAQADGAAAVDGDVCPNPIRVDGPAHSWRFDGDDPYIECAGCREYRDALSGRVIRAGTPNPTAGGPA